MTSRIPGFYKLSPSERLERVVEAAQLTTDPTAAMHGGLSLQQADLMVENVVGVLGLPNGIAVNMLINGTDRLVPMAVEEPSVVAAVSNMARLVRQAGGFGAESDPARMIAQIQLMRVTDPDRAVATINEHKEELLQAARAVHPRLSSYGGGICGIEVRRVTYEEPNRPREEMVVVHIVVDCADAMGANMVNTVAEQLAPRIASLTGEMLGLQILSNLADQRLSRATARVPVDLLATQTMDGATVCDRIAAAWRFAFADPYRATTHNKGVMNGIDAVAVATGNDWRAIEAGAHAYCARNGRYQPMTRWEVVDGYLEGSLELPLQFGTVGGPIRVHPTVQANLALMGSPGSRELASIAAAVGLAQNLAALRALATDGIQAGHMRMHARTVAATAGAAPSEVIAVSSELVKHADFSVERAKKVLSDLRSQSA